MKISTNQPRDSFNHVWVVAEFFSGKIQSVTYELIGAAKQLADTRQSKVWTIVMGSALEKHIPPLFAYGSDTVVVIDDRRLMRFNDELEANLLARLIKKHKPEILISGATSRGRALVSRVAVLTESGLTADCTKLAIDEDNNDLLQTRPAFGGNIIATIRCSNHRPQMATVRPRVMQPLKPEPLKPEPLKPLHQGEGTIIREKVTHSDDDKLKLILDEIENSEATMNLGDAHFIISGGRGLKTPQGFDLLKKLAKKVGGAVGASRAAVDAGWIPYTHQIGQTGQTVQAKVYMTCGISGQIQHLVGMHSCGSIIAIDKNPHTPMMQMADIAIVGDIYELIPEIIKELQET